MKRIMTIALFILPFIGLIYPTSFELDFTLFKNETAVVNELMISDRPPFSFDFFVPGPYKIALYDENNNLLWNKSTIIEMEVEGIGSDKPYIYENRTFFWRLPYFKNASKIVFSKRNSILFEIDLNKYFCSFDEKCPDFCKGKNIDPDCPIEKKREKEVPSKPVEKKEEKGGIPIWLYVVIALIILLLFIILMSVKVER